MSTVIELDGKQIILLKGASEIVLESCDKLILSSTGEIKNITPDVLQEMKDSIVSMAKKSLRTLCFAYK
jgi:magnesium-transporting ATPase (P-type)